VGIGVLLIAAVAAQPENSEMVHVRRKFEVRRNRLFNAGEVRVTEFDYVSAARTDKVVVRLLWGPLEDRIAAAHVRGSGQPHATKHVERPVDRRNIDEWVLFAHLVQDL
jgi:hypothetical protein